MAFWRKRYTSKHTGKEIDDAVDAVASIPEDIMANPMTAVGDIIIGGTDGEPEKLAKGTDGQVLTLAEGVPVWGAASGGMANPMTTAGDLIVGGADGTPARLAKGTAGQVLKMNADATAPEWATDSEGMANPMTAAGDIIVGGTDGAPARLAKGTDGQVLSMVSGAPAWAAAGGGGSSLYQHTVHIMATSGSDNVNIWFNIFNTQSASLTSNDIKTMLNANHNLNIIVNGDGFTQNKPFIAIRLKYESDTSASLNGILFDGSGYVSTTFTYANIATFDDVITQII